MPRNEEFDWIFDYSLQFLESDKFDAALMDFVDEKCVVFEDVDENKLIYTDIHREFCDHVETLISSNLNEVGITTELFLESCEKARAGRDINTTVFERLMAMEDFTTFKKLMTKRNIELQMESIRSFIAMSSNKAEAKGDESKSDAKRSGKHTDNNNDNNHHNNHSYRDDNDDDEYVSGKLPTRTLTQIEKDELEALQCFALGDTDFDNMSEEEIQELLFQSLVEMEFLHRAEELEHAELERALLLSLAQEEERLSVMLSDLSLSTAALSQSLSANSSNTARAEDKHSDNNTDNTTNYSNSVSSHAQDKASVGHTSASSASSASAKDDYTPNSNASYTANAVKVKSGVSLQPLPPLAGLRLKSDAKPLPSIGHQTQQQTLAAVADLEERKRQAELALQKSAQQLAQQREKEESLRHTVTQIDAAEAERRAQHMQQQRDLLLAKKKQEREEKVRREAEKQHQSHHNLSTHAESKDNNNHTNNSNNQRVSVLDAKTVSQLLQNREAEEKEALAQGVSATEVAELRRQNLRLALAKRLKHDVRQDEQAKQAALQENQFAQLDLRLKQVEEMREEHRQRDALLAKQLEKQKQQIARNIELSAAALRNNSNNSNNNV